VSESEKRLCYALAWIMVIAVRLSCTMKGVRTTRKFIVRSKKAKKVFRFSEEKRDFELPEVLLRRNKSFRATEAEFFSP
jgi:hypothetical protein